MTYAKRALAGLVLGSMLLLVGGLRAPAPADCHGCAILTHPYPGCTERVSEGWICG